MKRAFFILTAALAALTACEHKELCYNHPHSTITKLTVVFDWRNAPEAAPAGMSLFLFPQDNREPLRYEFTGLEGGTISVPSGDYRVLCLNNDTEAILFRGTSDFSTFELFTREEVLLMGLGIPSKGAPKVNGTEDERTALSPDMLWTDSRSEVFTVGSEAGQTLTLYPRLSVASVTVEVRRAENLKYVLGVSGSLSSMAGGYRPGPAAVTEERVIVPFEAVSDKVSTVRASFRTFGHCPALPNKHLLVLYAVLSDGSKWFYDYDVTAQVHAAEDPYNIHLVLEGLPLPKPIVNGGGFQPEINDWKPIEVEIEM